MNVMNIEGVTKTFGERILFQNISLGISNGDRIGIVGVNGTGKSTLLKMIAGEEEYDAGQIIMGNHVRIAYLPQNASFGDETDMIAYVTHHGEVAEHEARTMLNHIGIEDMSVPLQSLSGGQRKRVALASVLCVPSEVLILDEPTNHLDAWTIEWLQQYIKRYKGVLIMVTHDRYFLDAVTTRIVEIAHEQLYSYECNYSAFLEKKCEREALAQSIEQKQMNQYRIELAWVRRGAQARSTKQKARLQRFEDLKNRVRPQEEQKVQLESAVSRLGRKTIEMRHISKQYGERVLIADFNYNMIRNERIGIVGPNGCGKSTLLNIICGYVKPDAGEIEIGETIRIGYFAQEIVDSAATGSQAIASNVAFMDENCRVIDYVRDIAEYLPTAKGMISASQMLERFLFNKDMQYTPIRKLSGGEKRRLYLLSVLMQAPNVLILDEPTNDLDLSTLAVLEEYLDTFAGIVIVVSHDRYFLDRVVDRIFAFEGNGMIRQYEGGYTDYYLKCGKDMQASAPGSKSIVSDSSQEESSAKTGWKKQGRRLKFSYQEQRDYEMIDADIAALEDRIGQIGQEMEQNANQYMKLTALEEEKILLETQLEEKVDRWVYLNDLAERIAAGKIVEE